MPPRYAGRDVSGADFATIRTHDGHYYFEGDEYSFEVVMSLARAYHKYNLGSPVLVTFFKGDRILAEGYIHNEPRAGP